MGFFESLKANLEQEQITEIEKMEFKRFDKFTGSLIQRFADESFPLCPMCGEIPQWQLHIANITTRIFPFQEQDHIYHLKCQSCGAILHTKYHCLGAADIPRYIAHPSPRTDTVMVTVDNAGSKAKSSGTVGKAFSILELNSLNKVK